MLMWGGLWTGTGLRRFEWRETDHRCEFLRMKVRGTFE